MTASVDEPRAAARSLREGGPSTRLALGVFVALVLYFWAIGALFPDAIPHYATSKRQIIGMALMLTLLPPYVLVAWQIGRRRSLELIDTLRPIVLDPNAADAAQARIGRAITTREWGAATVIGLAMGLINTDFHHAFFESDEPVIDIGISCGQLFLWWIIALLFFARARAAIAFRSLAPSIQVDLFRLATLRPYARAGMVDVVIVTGALLFSPLQSLDAEFRIENYRFALMVATPSVLFYVIWPLIPIHRRLVQERDARIDVVDAQIVALGAAPPADAAETERLENLLAHRARLNEVHTWPVDLKMISRIFIYLVIPPLAWAGAALVERMVDAALGAG